MVSNVMVMVKISFSCVLTVIHKPKEIPNIQDTNGHTKIFLTDMESYNKNKTYNRNKSFNKNKMYFSPKSGPTAMKAQENIEEAILFDKGKERFEPALSHDKQSHKVLDKISEQYISKNYEVSPQPAFLFDTVKDKYEPALPYYKQTNKVRDKISEKHTTKTDDVAAELAILIDRVKNRYESKIPNDKQSTKLDDKIFEKYITQIDDAQPAILFDNVKDRYTSELLYNKESNKVQDRIFEEQTTKNDDVPTKRITVYKEDNMVYHPDMEYNDQFNQIRERFIGKRSTPGETKTNVFRPSQLINNYASLPEGFVSKIMPTLDERYGEVNAEKNCKFVTEDFKTKKISTPEEKYGDTYTEKNYKPVVEDLEKKRILVLDEKYGDVYAEKNYKIVPEDYKRIKRPTIDEKYDGIITEKNQKIISENFEGKIKPKLDARGDIYPEKVHKTGPDNFGRLLTKPTLNPRLNVPKNQRSTTEGSTREAENYTITDKFDNLYEEDDIPEEPERKVERDTEMFTTEISEPELNNTKRNNNEPGAIVYRKRSTRYYANVRAVKIKKMRTHDELTTSPSEDLTTMADYSDTNEQKETEQTPSYQVHENIVDIPDDRPLLGPIATDYVIVPEKHVPLHRKAGIPSLNLNSTDFDQEHTIVNIVQGMKDYFSVIGKGLYTAVKDIFKEKPS